MHVLPHPLAIKPAGNAVFADPKTCCRDRGLGEMAMLPDLLVLSILNLLDAKDLGRLACVSRSLYVFTHNEDLWRALVLGELEGRFRYKGTWRHTYIAHLPNQDMQSPPPTPIQVPGFYSDLLFQPWLCATTPIPEEWLALSTVPRRAGLSLEQFIEEFEKPNCPVILTDVVTQWPAYGKWSREYLKEQLHPATLSVGHYQMSLPDYYTYMDKAVDDQLMYLFDPTFAEQSPQLAQDYTVPHHFSEDLFGLMAERRPNYRWLLIGPARSGSTFHVDPNGTSAWNAVLTGAKRWVMYPPDEIPPGVHPSHDGADVSTPISLMEWFLDFYHAESEKSRSGRVECTVNAGEVLFIPSGWWHCVLNLDESIAITQNFASSTNIHRILHFMRSRPEQISGLRPGTDRHEYTREFETMLRESCPETMDALDQRRKRRRVEAGLFRTSATRELAGGTTVAVPFELDFGK